MKHAVKRSNSQWLSRCVGALALVVSSGIVSSCHKAGHSTNSGSLAALELLFAPDQPLVGDPNVFEIRVEASGGTFARGGDLPPAGEVIRVGALPVTNGARVSASLHRNKIDLKTKTHQCDATDPVDLRADVPASVQLSCLAVANADGAPTVRVFLKMASLEASLTQLDPALTFAGRDWTEPTLFAATGADGRRLSISSDTVGFDVHLAGDFGWRVSGPDALQRLLKGETLEMRAVTGTLIDVFPATATLSAPKGVRAWEREDGSLGALLSVQIKAGPEDTPIIDISASLLEEQSGQEFTLVSWNVENLFDQVDEDRNAGYGDYRINPNQSGQTSNWGAPVENGGSVQTWTDAKIAGIRKALLAVDPRGPAVVALTEIESRTSLEMLAASLQGFGYKTVQFSDWSGDIAPTAVGMGLISKFDLLDWSLIKVRIPPQNGRPDTENPRPILKVILDVHGHPMTVYVNHWKSKGGPESARMAYAQALQADIDALTAVNPRADWIIAGDLNSDYNERVILEPRHNDTGGITGINSILAAQGDELAVVRNLRPGIKYNLHYELDRSSRKTSWHQGFNWSSLDHIVVGPGVYDQVGLTYVDNSFQIAHRQMPELAFLFNEDGTTRRWRSRRNGLDTIHELGGFSDHAPLFARFRVAPTQSPSTILLFRPGRPDATDGL